MKLFGFSSFAFNCRPSSWKHRWIGVCKWKRNEILFESTLYMIHSSTWDETNKPYHFTGNRFVHLLSISQQIFIQLTYFSPLHYLDWNKMKQVQTIVTYVTILLVIVSLVGAEPKSKSKGKKFDRTIKVNGKDLTRKSIVFDKDTPDVFYCIPNKPTGEDKIIVR